MGVGRLFYRCTQKGSPSVLFISGLGDSCESWQVVRELHELLLESPVQPPFILAGHSFGGMIARLFASLYPALVSGIVLVDAAPEYKELAYEKVLPARLIAENRAYLENPMRNSEKIDKLQSYQEIVIEEIMIMVKETRK